MAVVLHHLSCGVPAVSTVCGIRRGHLLLPVQGFFCEQPKNQQQHIIDESTWFGSSANEEFASMVTTSSFCSALFPLPFKDGPAPFALLSKTELPERPPGRTGYATPRPFEE